MMKKKKNKKIKNTDAQIALRMLIASLCFALISVILVTVIKKFPDFANGVYTKWSVTAMHTLSKVFSFVRFSVAEVLIYIISLVFIISLVILINNLVKKKGKLGRLFKYLTSWILTVSIITFLFYALWGGMYYTKGISNYINISEEDIKERSVEELAALNRYLIDKANEQAEKVIRNEQGLYQGYINRNASSSARKVSEIQKRRSYTQIISSSNPCHHTQTSGIFIFLTGEAKNKQNNLAIALPFTCAHELAIRRDTLNESKLLAFYTFNNSRITALLYSAYSMA